MAPRKPLPGISSRAWEHPADRAALQAMRDVPGFDRVVRRLMGTFSERPLRLITLGSAVEVGPRQYPSLNAVYEELLLILDAPQRYGLYVSQSPVLPAGAVGMDDPFIVLNATTVQLLDADQLRVLLAHELGHILSGHVLYKTMLKLMLKGGSFALRMPLTGLALVAVLGSLLEWDRKSALSADRASLLAAQDPEAVRTSLLRLAGGVGPDSSVSAFADQARRYEEEGGVLDSLLKTLTLLSSHQPFPVLRMRELDRWIEAGGYQAVMDGDYPRRDTDDDETRRDLWREAMGSYAEGVKATTAPVGRWVKGAGEEVGKAAGAAWGWVRGKGGSDRLDDPSAEAAAANGDEDEPGNGDEDDIFVDPDGVIDIDPDPPR